MPSSLLKVTIAMRVLVYTYSTNYLDETTRLRKRIAVAFLYSIDAATEQVSNSGFLCAPNMEKTVLLWCEKDLLKLLKMLIPINFCYRKWKGSPILHERQYKYKDNCLKWSRRPFSVVSFTFGTSLSASRAATMRSLCLTRDHTQQKWALEITLETARMRLLEKWAIVLDPFDN